MSAPGQTKEVAAFGEDDLDDDAVETVETTNETEDDAEESVEPAVRADGKPFSASDLVALQTALKAARKEARALKAAVSTTDPAKTSEDAAAQAAKAAEAKYKPVVVRQAAKAAFAEAGLASAKGEQAAAFAKAFKLLDLNEITIDETGEVDGLTDQIEELKSEFPQLFRSPRPGRIQGADREGQGTAKPKSSADAIAAMFT